jgi:hypothetical protein
VQPVAQHRERVEERREGEVDIQDLVLQRPRPPPELERARPAAAAALEQQPLGDEAGAGVERVVEPVVGAELCSLRDEAVSFQLDEGDLEPWLVEPTPGVDTGSASQNSRSLRTASTTRSTEGM